MKSLWDDRVAGQFETPLGRRAYTSRLLGQSDDLVLHGGGNTSVKDAAANIFAEPEEILYVKGSGHDLRTIGENGFAPTRLAHLKRLAELDTLSDTDMMRELKCSLTNPQAPAPSVEAILHALIPHKYVDHTHADAVVTISNTVGGEEKIRAIYGEHVLVLPYVMPGFILARQVFKAAQSVNWQECRAIILLHHGVFTFADDARESYENMIEIVTIAEDYIASHVDTAGSAGSLAPVPALEFARARKQVGLLRGGGVVGRFLANDLASLENMEDCSRRGPLTPDHVLHTKRIPMVLTGEHQADAERFAAEYRDYFSRHAQSGLTCLDVAPRWAVWKGRGVATFAPNGKRLEVCTDIVDHTARAIWQGEKLGGWQALPEKDIFELEYWELEQAKLGKSAKASEFEGRVAVVTGAASGIGRATAEMLIDEGACVIGLDIDSSVTALSASPLYLGLVVDLTTTSAVRKAFSEGVLHFGGVDILFSNAGSFPPGSYLEQTTDAQWSGVLSVNLDSHFRVLREAIPYLREGFDSAVVINASKNAIAPGPGVGAYSVAKAALTQLARVAAMELAADGVRVNVLHPDAVFDTAIWTDDMLKARADKYGLSIEDYKRRNLLKTEIASVDVARAVLALLSKSFGKSTGLQLTIDGGNERTI